MNFNCIATALFLLVAGLNFSRANDSIFPPQAAAKGAADFDGRGFLINGQRTFIVSAGMEYARVPHELWADRLMRFKRAGFNCTEFYTFWDFHEPTSGQFDFTGDRDLGAYLKLAQSLGLYAIARVGPYYCAEWDSGGYPVWLRSVPNLQVRVDNAPFEQYVSRFWGQLLPIVFTNQINRGGNVILVQLENEHSSGWGTDGLGDRYFQYLQTNAMAHGLEVPYFFSGLNHAHDPAGNSAWSSSSRSSPWMSTEFWCDWFDQYGETAADVNTTDYYTWKIIAYGGNGYNYYMAHGGSDFDYFNDDEDAASYDYGAAVGQAGDLRGEYYRFKRAAWFARSFQSILETSDNATGNYASAATNSAIAVTARQSTAGTILFLANAGSTAQQTRVNVSGVAYPQAGSLTVNGSEIMPVVTAYPLLPGVMLNVAPTRILGITQQGDTTTMVIHGQAGSPAELYFSVPAGTTVSTGAPALSVNGTNLALKTTYPASGAAEYSFQTGARRVRILAMNSALADDTWFVDVGRQNFVVVGPQYVGDAYLTNGCLQVATDVPWQNPAGNPVTAYGSSDTPMSLTAVTAPGTHPGTATLSAWQTMSGTAPATPGLDTSGWLSSEAGPQQMGADGDASCYAWYRTTVTAPTADTYTILMGSAADHMEPFLDGVAISAANVSGNSFTASLSAGTHTLAIFTSHYGRNKLVGYNGPIAQNYVKGLTGTTYALGGLVSGPTSLTSWKMMLTNSTALQGPPPATNAADWSNYSVGSDAFGQQSGYAWFQTILPSAATAGAEIVNFSSVDDNGWVYLNGVLLATNVGWNVSFNVNLNSAWNPAGPNVLTVLVQNTENIGGLDSAVTFSAYRNASMLNSWVQRGGPGDPNAASGWQALGSQTFNGPQFFKSTFTAAPPENAGTDPMWRVTTTGLSHGSVWVNGHNLGRYPETIPAPGLYVPECWLNAGANGNTLVIYDEAGNRPTQVRVQPEAAASRDVVMYRTTATVSLKAAPAPIGLMAVANGTQANLTWNASPGATSYNIKRSTFSGAETTVGVSATTNYVDAGLDRGKTFYYVVSAVDSDNEGYNSGEVMVATQPNLALGQPAASDSQQSGNPAANGNDGSLGTRWCANDSGLNHWWRVDLGQIYALSGIELVWERNAVYRYIVAVSTNGSTWTTAVDKSANATAVQDQTSAFTANARYVRVTVTGLAGGNWASFYECQIFGPNVTNAALANGCYFVYNRNSGLAMEAFGGGTTNGTQIDQAVSMGSANQAWSLTNLGAGEYQITGVQSGLSLETPGVSTNDVNLGTLSGGDNQKWLLAPLAGNAYEIQSVASGLSLRVAGDSTASGALVEAGAVYGASGLWSLQPAAHLPWVQCQSLNGQINLWADVFQPQSCVLETSTNLVQWQPVMTNTPAGPGILELTDQISWQSGSQFYRVHFEQ